ncbi:MAG: response regulator [Methanomicrobiaceae archaeon]|nr:response regulator [Methanomicrobiaceae archaeon]
MLHILMVDEQPEILEIASIYLNKCGDYIIDKAFSATEALSKLQISSYDAIVSDYDMPEMDGLSFLKEVRRMNNTLPFVIFSGKGREEVIIEAFRCGADGFVQKGKDPSTQFAELNHQILIISKRRQAENELRMKEYAIETSINGILMFNDEKLVTYVNTAAMKLHGYESKEDILEKNISEIFDLNTDGNNDTDFYSEVSEKGWYFGEQKGLKKDGKRFDVQLSVIRIINEMTGEKHYFGSYVDITERKKAEKALLEFITEAAKRLKSPVTHICRNLAEVIEQFDTTKNPELLKMKLSVQLKNAQQVIENLNELNEAISNGYDSIPEDYRDFLTR